MAEANVRCLLDEVQHAQQPSAARFDDGPPLTNRVAVLPSAFNPPTVAHIALLETARETDGIGSVAALLSTRNVDKGVTGASLDDRIGMLLAVHRESPWLAVLAANQARIMDQATALAAAFPAMAFDFVVGYDTLIRLFDTRYYTAMEEELTPFFEVARVVALNRGEAGVDAVRLFIEREAAPFAHRILVRELAAHPASLSSTLARDAIGQGAATAIVPPSAAAYIRDHGLYR